jgi:hypothetical protein
LTGQSLWTINGRDIQAYRQWSAEAASVKTCRSTIFTEPQLRDTCQADILSGVEKFLWHTDLSFTTAWCFCIIIAAVDAVSSCSHSRQTTLVI